MCNIFMQTIETPMVAAKFLHLKHLDIFFNHDDIFSYNYMSLVSFLDASLLETFNLSVSYCSSCIDI